MSGGWFFLGMLVFGVLLDNGLTNIANGLQKIAEAYRSKKP